MYYECSQCDQMMEIAAAERSPVTQQCPVCEEVTAWEAAFEGEGVTF